MSSKIGEIRTYETYNLNGCTIRYDQCIPMITNIKRPPVLSKKNFYERFAKGEFGNTSPQWYSLEEWQQSNYKGEVAIRTKVPGGKCIYFIPYTEVGKFWAGFIRNWGYAEDQLQISAQCPEKDKLLQGYFGIINGKKHLWYSTNTELAMRNALIDDCKHAEGLKAWLLIKNRMCPNSWEWFNHLLDTYPEHIIEFTILRYPWGTLYPLYNTLFWEVRLY